jgi:hypothetical protein
VAKFATIPAFPFKLRSKQNNSGGTQNGRNGVGATADVVLSSMTKIEEFDNDIWIGDSGASCHYCNNDAVLYDYTTICEDITVGNGNVIWENYDVRFFRKMVRAWLSRLKT